MMETVAVVQTCGARRPAALGLALVLAAGGALSMPLPAGAALDGSTPMLCAPATVMECDASKCERQTGDDADLPSFVRVDVPNKMVTAVPGGKQTAIKTVARLDGRLVLQGSESGRSWTATIAEDSGKISIAVVDQDHTFAIFGACVTP